MYSINFLYRFVLVFVLSLFFLPTFTLADDYLIGPGDVLKIDVYDHADLKTTVRVANDGKIVVPLLGQVEVAGMKLSDVTDKITTSLADGYIINPQVNIFIEDYRSKKAVILGHVNKPGLVELRGNTTFLEAVSNAGGFKDKAGETATIKRISGEKQKVIVVNIKSMLQGGDLTQNIPIHDGDTIFISETGMCYVTGEVKHPDAYPCDDETTVLKVITRAGGFTGKASKSSVRVVRLIDGKKTILEDVNLHSAITANDIVVVPESFF